MTQLLLLFITPLIGSIFLFLLKGIPAKFLKLTAFLISLIPLVMLITWREEWIGSDLFFHWIPHLSIDFHLNVDSLSYIFLWITALIIPFSLLTAKCVNLEYPNLFYGLILLLQSLLICFFTAKDLALFTIFWEGMLLPLYFLIGLWGGPQKRSAAIQFLIYMIAGSSLLVAAVLALFFAAGAQTFNMDELATIAKGAPHAIFLFAIFALAFAVKTPLFPFHSWLPLTYFESSTSITILLSAVLSKAGIYGFLRIGNGFFSEQMQEWSFSLAFLAIIGVFYGGFAAWRQSDFKKLIAYSSFSHVNFILAGAFTWTALAQTGAILQSLNHALIITALFYMAGRLSTRLGGTSMKSVQGLGQWMPKLCWLSLFFALASISLPGTNSFIGELLILAGLFAAHPFLASALALSVILSAMYMLRWIQNVFFNEPISPNPSWTDLSRREWIVLLPLIALILWIGLYPMPTIDIIEPGVESILLKQSFEESK